MSNARALTSSILTARAPRQVIGKPAFTGAHGGSPVEVPVAGGEFAAFVVPRDPAGARE
jgi:hypothetical protein